jgi:DNA repair Crb2-like protein
MANIGDRVLAKWPVEKDWWYPGVVVGTGLVGLEVQFDDGDRTSVTDEEYRPLQLGIGSRVYCRWKGGGEYYPGKVSMAVGDAIHVEYDDGDKETTSVSMVRVNQADL